MSIALIAEEKVLGSVWQKNPVIARLRKSDAIIRNDLVTLESPLSYTVNT